MVCQILSNFSLHIAQHCYYVLLANNLLGDVLNTQRMLSGKISFFLASTSLFSVLKNYPCATIHAKFIRGTLRSSNFSYFYNLESVSASVKLTLLYPSSYRNRDTINWDELRHTRQWEDLQKLIITLK